MIAPKIKEYKTWGTVTVRGKLIERPATYKGKGITLLYLASLEETRKRINNQNIVPATFAFNKALVSVTVFDFLESPVGPYTELVLSVPVFYKPRVVIPLLSVLGHRFFPNFGFFVLDILQSTDIAIEHGNILTGYPHNHELISINFSNKENKLSIDIKGLNLKNIFSLQAEIVNKETAAQDIYMTYFQKNEESCRIRMDVYGIKKNCSKVSMTLGDHRIADYIRNLGLSLNNPIQADFYEEVTEINPVSIESV